MLLRLTLLRFGSSKAASHEFLKAHSRRWDPGPARTRLLMGPPRGRTGLDAWGPWRAMGRQVATVRAKKGRLAPP
jgi:hypothetical protein